ncbi:F-box domain-containing protein [Mycena sanguinolenta]|uniref:F-box domain-containing protein n=1 Tax=Mycena sanguinolenta TaxID=230812 RepID=A0A8H6X7I1_9AGAR|nr:F-box domain-containing protein [Mycena sanguinolenta]
MSTASSRAADRVHIAEIDAKISSLREVIRALKAEKFRTQERLNSYAYPVLTLPNEVISDIFLKFIPKYPSPTPLMGPLSPTTLTHVCHQWREIALSTRALEKHIGPGLLSQQALPTERTRIVVEQVWLLPSFHLDGGHDGRSSGRLCRSSPSPSAMGIRHINSLERIRGLYHPWPDAPAPSNRNSALFRWHFTLSDPF